MGFLDFFTDNWAILLPPLLGLAAIYALLPRPKRTPVLLGAGAAGLALVVSALTIVRVGGLSTAEEYIEAILFYLFAAIAVVAGGLLVTQQNPARAALSFALVVLATTGLFLLQAAPFLMAATIIVYAGAIIVTFLFVLMLAQQQGPSDADARSREPFLASMTGFLLLIALLYILNLTYKPDFDRKVRESEEMLARVQSMIELEAAKQATDVKKEKLVGDIVKWRTEYERWLRNEPPAPKPVPLGARELYNALFNLESQLTDKARKGDLNLVQLKELDKLMVKVVEEGRSARNDPHFGSLRPRGSEFMENKMSEMSGPTSGRPLKELRRDNLGRPHLPAENTVYVGRSLFSDYLLPVELAGTLLLIATIGAIAIAHRKDIEQRTTARSTNGTVPRRNA